MSCKGKIQSTKQYTLQKHCIIIYFLNFAFVGSLSMGLGERLNVYRKGQIRYFD